MSFIYQFTCLLFILDVLVFIGCFIITLSMILILVTVTEFIWLALQLFLIADVLPLGHFVGEP